VDAAGGDVPNTVVHLSCDRRTTVHVNGFSYMLRPSESVPVRADPSGRVAVRVISGRKGPNPGDAMVSADLTAPRITASLRPPNRPPIDAPFSPDLSLYKRMADAKVMTGEQIGRASCRERV